MVYFYIDQHKIQLSNEYSFVIFGFFFYSIQ